MASSIHSPDQEKEGQRGSGVLLSHLSNAEAQPAHVSSPLTQETSLSSSSIASSSALSSGESLDDSASQMAIASPRPQRASLVGEQVSDGDEADSGTPLSASPAKRHSGRLSAALSRLHFRPTHSNQHGDGGGAGIVGGNGGPKATGGSNSNRVSRDFDHDDDAELGLDLYGHSGQDHAKSKKGAKGSSKLSSGKHTPTSTQATGDFADFLRGEEIKEALAKEKEKEIKRDLKLAKHPTRGKKGQGGATFGGKGKVRTPEQRYQNGKKDEDEVKGPPEPTLEEKGYFPGDWRHHGHWESKKTLAASRASSQHDREGQERGFSLNSIAPCGPVSDSEDEGKEPHHGHDDDTTEGGHQSTTSSPKMLRRISLNRRKSSSAVSTDSSASSSSDILQPVESAPDASVVSLKSWQSQPSSNRSLASGGANPALQKPLLELEELELDSFIKNFGRHTREIRVPQSANFPRRRLPRWEDFKVPAGEEALARAQGKRITVLTHVDRGLKAMAESEGQGVPLPRLAPKDKSSKKSREAQLDYALELAGKSAERERQQKSQQQQQQQQAAEHGRQSPTQQRVTFATDEKRASIQRPESPELQLASLKQRNLEKDEKLAKKEDKEIAGEDNENHLETSVGLHRFGGVDIHDAAEELRPSRDEVNLGDEDWEVLNKAAAAVEEVPAPEDEKVDSVAWAIAYILALVERYAPEELDNSPDQTYREGKLRSHVERLYLIAPFWERFLYGIRRVYRWDDPKRTSTFAMVYFTLWYADLIPTAFGCIIIYYILQFRFFPPSASYLHEQVRARMARGIEADRLAERLRRRSRLDVLEIYKRFVISYGSASMIACGDVADFHEKVKNLILWRNPAATWRTLTLFATTTTLVTIVPAHLVWKAIFFFLGLTFFILLPLQSHYPRFRRPLSPIWWALWGTPTDGQFAVQLLRRRHLERQRAKHPPILKDKDGAAFEDEHDGDASSSPNKKKKSAHRSQAAHAVAYGSMRPLRDDDEGLLDLEDELTTKSGEVKRKPRKLGSFFCQHHGVPGHLHVTTKMLYFVALHAQVGRGSSHKTCKTPLEDIAGLVKTKSIRLFVWSSSGLQVVRSNKSSLFFSNMPHRDNAFNLLLACGSEVWSRR